MGTGSQDFFRIFNALFRRRVDSLQRIINMQIFPLEDSQRMVRKNLHSLHGFQRTDKISQAMKLIVTIIALRYH